MGAEHYKGLGPADAAVRLVPELDLKTARLSAQEGFVLSRVDGTSSVQTICLTTGLGEQRTIAILTDLHQKGVIIVGDEDPAPADTGASAEPGREAGPLQQVDTLVDPGPPAAAAPEQTAEPADAAPSEQEEGGWQDSDTAEECDLKPEVRKKIRDLHASLRQLNLFDLFDVSPEADLKQIRKAFFIKSKVFHPDRYFNKKLGPYGEMLHEIFKQMNAGYKMLCDKEKLAQYRGMVVQQREQERMAREVEQQARDMEEDPEEEQQPAPSTVRQRQLSGTFRAHRAKALMDLVGQRRSGERPATQAPVDEPPERRQRRQTDHKLRTKRITGALFSRAKKAQQFYVQGKQQLERGQYLAATASLKLAASFNPDEKEYGQLFDLASNKAAELTAENHYKRGMMEESVGRFDAAAESFVLAADQNPRAPYLMKAAEAMLWSHSADDLIKAKDYATRAVRTDPNSVDVRLIAARVFRAAGMKRNARRELQMALKIEPGNAEAKEMLKGV